MEIEGYEHRFSSMNPQEVQLPSVKTVLGSLDLMETREDWANLPNLLSGLYFARGKHRVDRLVVVTRRAGERGFVYAVIDCAMRVKKTGFVLENSEVVASILYYTVRKGLDSGWEEEATKKGLTWAELVLDLLQDPNHAGKKARGGDGEFPLHRDPLILAQVLSLAAVRAAKHTDGKDIDGKVSKYAEFLTRAWPEGKGFKTMYTEADYRSRERMQYLHSSATQYLSVTSPALYGIETAAGIVEPELSEKLRAIAAVLRPEVEGAARDPASQKAIRGMKTYEALFGPAQ
jgi:hypothetical protein